MKKIFFVAFALLFAYATSYAQIKVPGSVTKAFEQKFPAATKVKWDKENAKEYEASFEMKGEKYSANFSNTGKWVETESPIQFNELPQKVQEAFSKEHKGKTIKVVAKIEHPDGKTKYEIEYKNGSKTAEVVFDEGGVKTK